jgi:hypothetical protein
MNVERYVFQLRTETHVSPRLWIQSLLCDFNKNSNVTNLSKTHNVKISIFWDIMPCGSLKANRHFGEGFRFHLQDRRRSHERNQSETGGKQSLLFEPEDGEEILLRNVG